MIKVIRPFGPTIAKVKMPNDLIKELNLYLDEIILDDEKKKNLDYGKYLDQCCQKKKCLQFIII